MPSKGVLLDVDSSILERNLKITDETPEEEYMNKLFPDVPYKLHKPFPGMCWKMWLENQKKLFVNICQLDVIPEPQDIKPEDVYNEEISFRVPMSIGDMRYEMDKKGEEATVVDIAVHSNFFNKVTNSDIMTQFFIQVVKESLGDKYKLKIQDEVKILKNKKCFGELQMHRIRKQEVDEKMGKKEPLIKEISSKKATNTNKPPQIEVLSESSEMKTPKHRLIKSTDKIHIIAEILLPYANNSKDFTLDIGEDRLILEGKGNYFLDIFFPNIEPEKTIAKFDVKFRVLTVTMELQHALL